MYFIPHTGQIKRARASDCGPTCWPISVCRMAGRLSSCCLTRCCCSAQPWHRCNSFFWPLTMSVRWIVAGLGQYWHFTPVASFAGVGDAPLSPVSPFLDLADAVAEAGGLLVVLAADGLLELLAQVDQLGLFLLAL